MSLAVEGVGSFCGESLSARGEYFFRGAGTVILPIPDKSPAAYQHFRLCKTFDGGSGKIWRGPVVARGDYAQEIFPS